MTAAPAQAKTDEKISIPDLNRLLADAHENNDVASESAIYGMLGNAYDDLDDLERARLYFELALVAARNAEDKELEADSLGSLGNVCFRSLDYKQAILYYEQALDIQKKLQHHDEEVLNSLSYLGSSYSLLDEFDTAATYYKEGLRLVEDNDVRKPYFLFSLYNCYVTEKDEVASEYKRQLYETIEELSPKVETKYKIYFKYLVKKVETFESRFENIIGRPDISNSE